MPTNDASSPATKADLHDLRQVQQQMQQMQQQMQQMQQQMQQMQQQMQQMQQQMQKRFDYLNESIDQVLVVLGNMDRKLMGRLENHEGRIERLEEHTGIMVA